MASLRAEALTMIVDQGLYSGAADERKGVLPGGELREAGRSSTSVAGSFVEAFDDGRLLGHAAACRRDPIRPLPGCATQGETVTMSRAIARVAQPWWVGRRFSDHLTRSLILIYLEITWHNLEHARTIVDTLRADTIHERVRDGLCAPSPWHSAPPGARGSNRRMS